MRTKKEIQKELKKYEILDHPEKWEKKGLYVGPAPMSEWAMYQDRGFRDALKWVLEDKTAS